MNGSASFGAVRCPLSCFLVIKAANSLHLAHSTQHTHTSSSSSSSFASRVFHLLPSSLPPVTLLFFLPVGSFGDAAQLLPTIFDPESSLIRLEGKLEQ